MKIRILFLTALLCAGIGSLQSANAATITVTNTNNSGAGSLRQALVDANDGDTIDFSITTPATITLTSGELVLDKSVTISGPGAANLAVNGNAAGRVFYVSSGKTVTISGLTITNGHVADDFGGGIYNDHATLIVINSTLSGNSAASGDGGGITNDGTQGSATLTINNSTLSGNSASFRGGGIYNDGSSGSATLTVTNSTLNGNSASDGDGGGIYNYGEFGSVTLTVTNSTLSGNSAASGDGGGIFNHGEFGSVTLTVTNSTLSGNSASSGGGILNDGENSGSATLTINNSTLSGNSASSGGGILNDGVAGSATLTIGDTILKAGASGENIFSNSSTVTSLGYNLSSDNASAFLNQIGDQNGTEPMLGPLQDNGGPTLTHLPLSGSPAIDAGDPTAGMDQRSVGFPRVANGRIDVGAVEVEAASIPAAPTATAATNVTSSSFIANWTSVGSATGYRLDVAKNSSFMGGTFVTGYHNLNVGNVTSRFVGGLNANTTYYFRVRAFNSIGVSSNSNVITVTTSP